MVQRLASMTVTLPHQRPLHTLDLGMETLAIMILHPLQRYWELVRQHFHKLTSYRSSTMEHQASLMKAARFDDGTNTLDVSYEVGNSAFNSIISLGNIRTSNYANFFGFTDPFAGYGDIACILFDIDGYSDVNPFASSFSVTLSELVRLWH